jgi:hypothetical protein
MKISEPEKFKLAASIGAVKSPVSSTTVGASACEQSEDWIKAGTWRFPVERIAVMGQKISTFDVWLDAGLTVELTLRDDVSPDRVIQAIVKKQDLTPLVTYVNVCRS